MKNTEQRNPKSMRLDKMTTLEAVTLMNNEDKTVAYAVEKALPAIAQAVDLVVDSFKKGGRLIYVGAGTSGRLGVLDASECPPTYGVPYGMVVGVIAGGKNAVFKAAEGAEDSGNSGVKDMQEVGVNAKDTVVGISVSGDAAYIYDALEYAQSVGAHAVALTGNPENRISQVAEVAILTDTGAEVVTGSTRLKAGTAHKMVLNMLSTVAMVRTGKVIENLMVNVAPTNIKLFDRAARIVDTLTGIGVEKAKEELSKGRSIVEIVGDYEK
ncbi:MAG: N-acetylmuramic acid 6-phosphate etherase [Clostridia bacterium]|nr:N-acetylmuramic acid 6-phosphate etherase [Clostridia bacterium]